jgi:hypothetical protein
MFTPSRCPAGKQNLAEAVSCIDRISGRFSRKFRGTMPSRALLLRGRWVASEPKRARLEHWVMTLAAGDFVWRPLHEWDARKSFGYPGAGINGLLGGLTGEQGMRIATSGPGASHRAFDEVGPDEGSVSLDTASDVLSPILPGHHR